MKRWLCSVLLIFILCGSASAARKVNIKLGTFAPDSSFWVDYLKEMGADWKKISKNKVRLKIYAGGVAGDEPTMVRKLNVGQLKAATLTVLGLHEIVPEILVFGTPMLFRSDAEVAYVFDRISGDLERKFEKRGYKILQWGTFGWVYLFSREPVRIPAELEKQKMYVGTPEGSKIYQAAGFKTMELAPTDILMGLQTNLITAYNTPPVASLAYQWFGLAQNMIDQRWAPALVATVVKKKTWDKISPEYKKEIEAVALRIGEKGIKKVNEFELLARDMMLKKGLKLQTLNKSETKLWKDRFEKTYPLMKAKVGDELFNKVVTLLKEYRAKKN